MAWKLERGEGGGGHGLMGGHRKGRKIPSGSKGLQGVECPLHRFLEAKERNAWRADIVGGGKDLPKLSNSGPR